jgi:hypothetical protein
MRRIVVLCVAIASLSVTSSGAPRLSPSGVREPGSRLTPVGAYQQHEGHAHGARPVLSLAIDGSSNPELISDERAYAHFLAAIAENPQAMNAALRKAAVDPPDRVAFARALGSLREELTSLENRRSAGGSAQQFHEDRGKALRNARTRVGFALSPAGYGRLDAYVKTEVKRRIKVYRAPMPDRATESAR